MVSPTPPSQPPFLSAPALGAGLGGHAGTGGTSVRPITAVLASAESLPALRSTSSPWPSGACLDVPQPELLEQLLSLVSLN